MTKRMSIVLVVGLLYAAATNVYLAFWEGWHPFNLVAAIVCVGVAVLIWRQRP